MYLKTTAREQTYKGIVISVKCKCFKKHSRASEALNIFLNEFQHRHPYGMELFPSVFQRVLLLHVAVWTAYNSMLLEQANKKSYLKICW